MIRKLFFFILMQFASCIVVHSQNILQVSAVDKIEILIKESSENIYGYKYLIRSDSQSFSVYQIQSFSLPVHGEQEFDLFVTMDYYFNNDPLNFINKLNNTFFDEMIEGSKYTKDQIKYYYRSRILNARDINNTSDTLWIDKIDKIKIQAFLYEWKNSYEIDSLDDLLKLAQINTQSIKVNADKLNNKFFKDLQIKEQECLERISDSDKLHVVAKHMFVENPFNTSIEEITIEIQLVTNKDEKRNLKIVSTSDVLLPIMLANDIKSYNIELIEALKLLIPNNEILKQSNMGVDNFIHSFFRHATKIYCR